MFNSEISELIGKEKLEEIKLKSGKKIKTDGLFIEIGGIPNIKLAEKLKINLDAGAIIVDKNQEQNSWSFCRRRCNK
jgi:thioredoxin reductase